MASIVNEQGGDTSQQMSSGEALYRAIMKNNGVTFTLKDGCYAYASNETYNSLKRINNTTSQYQPRTITLLPSVSCTNGNRSVSSVTLTYSINIISTMGYTDTDAYGSTGAVQATYLSHSEGSESISGLKADASINASGIKTDGNVTKSGIITITNPRNAQLVLGGVQSSSMLVIGSTRYVLQIDIHGTITVTLNVTSMTLSDGTVVTP